MLSLQVSTRIWDPVVLKIFNWAAGVVVPIPTFPVEEINIDEVAWAAPASLPTMKYPLAREISEIASQPLPAPPETQVPLMAKQPDVISIPLDRVEVEVSERYEPVPIPRLVTESLGRVEVAVVEVAVKDWAPVWPATE